MHKKIKLSEFFCVQQGISWIKHAFTHDQVAFP